MGQILYGSTCRFWTRCVSEDLVQTHLAEGRLRRALEEWCPHWPGYHLCYPSRRQSSAAFALLVDALRHRS